VVLQIIIGLVVILATAVVHANVLSVALRKNQKMTKWVQSNPTHWRTTTAFSVSVTWVMAAHLIEVFLWSSVYMSLGIFEELEVAVYFSLVAYTTLGFGDVILPEQWRILAGLTAANGFLVFGWSTAFQVEYVSRLNSYLWNEEGGVDSPCIRRENSQVLVVSSSRCGNSCGNYRAGLLCTGAIFYSTSFSMKLFERSLKDVFLVSNFSGSILLAISGLSIRICSLLRF
jgi:hypothetical protein